MDNIAETPSRAGWPDFSLYRPHPAATRLRDWLGEAHDLTRVLTQFLGNENRAVPLLQIVNPPLWELGHIAWFQEFWLQRGGDFAAPSMLPHADRWYDSARVAHDNAVARLRADVPDVGATVQVMTNDDQALADEIADDMNEYIWRVRERFANGALPQPGEAARIVRIAAAAGGARHAPPAAVGTQQVCEGASRSKGARRGTSWPKKLPACSV